MFCIPLPFQSCFCRNSYFCFFAFCSLNVFFDSKDLRWSVVWSCWVQSTSSSLSRDRSVRADGFFRRSSSSWQCGRCELLLCTWESLDCWSIADISSLQPYCLHITENQVPYRLLLPDSHIKIIAFFLSLINLGSTDLQPISQHMNNLQIR